MHSAFRPYNSMFVFGAVRDLSKSKDASGWGPRSRIPEAIAVASLSYASAVNMQAPLASHSAFRPYSTMFVFGAVRDLSKSKDASGWGLRSRIPEASAVASLSYASSVNMRAALAAQSAFKPYSSMFVFGAVRDLSKSKDASGWGPRSRTPEAIVVAGLSYASAVNMQAPLASHSTFRPYSTMLVFGIVHD